MSRRLTVLLGLLLVLGVAGWDVSKNERILAAGQPVRLVLAPVDPRSLMQGDYMALNYEVQNRIRATQAREDGYLVVTLDADGVGHFVRTQQPLQPLATEEVALRYRIRPGMDLWGGRRNGVRIATNAFFFEEGSGKRFEKARYGEFRVDANGEPRLVGLLDAERRLLGSNRY